MEEKELTIQDLAKQIQEMREIIDTAKPDKKGYSNEEIDTKFNEIMKHIDNVNSKFDNQTTKPVEQNEETKEVKLLDLFKE